MNKFLKFEYWDDCDIGNLYYQGGQHFWFYLDADVGETFYEEVEKGEENENGDFIPTYRRQIKKYTIRTGLLPEFFIDALYRMKLHEYIYLTWKTGEVERIYNVTVEHEWQFDEKYYALCTIKFDMNEVVVLSGCCTNLE